MLRILTLAGGLLGAAGLSQYPEFSQQYLQRLSGQIDALRVVVADFDASAARADLNREEALAQMTGTAFLEDRRADMTRTFARFYGLQAERDALAAASPLERMALPHRLADRDTFLGTWDDFTPAMPLSIAGLASGGFGFLLGASLVAALAGLLRAPFRRARKPRPEVVRREPRLQ